MLKILQARLQQYVNRELPDVQAGFRKGRETRGQIANIHWIMGKAACNVGNLGSIPGLGRSPGGGHGNPPQYSCPVFLSIPMDRGAWWATE